MIQLANHMAIMNHCAGHDSIKERQVRKPYPGPALGMAIDVRQLPWQILLSVLELQLRDRGASHSDASGLPNLRTWGVEPDCNLPCAQCAYFHEN